MDSRLFSEANDKFKNLVVIGGPGYTLEDSIPAIEQHYEANKEHHDAIVYKVTTGINDTILKQRGKKITLFYDSPVVDHVNTLLDLPNNHTKMFISLCPIPGANINKYNGDLRALIKKNGIPPMQGRLEGMLDVVNEAILDKSDERWVDLISNAEYADRINCNKSWRKLRLPKSIIKRMEDKCIAHPKYLEYRTNHNRLVDGLHFTDKHKDWCVELLLGSMKLERQNIRALIVDFKIPIPPHSTHRHYDYKR